MATYNISPPETFSFTSPEEWPKWIRRFERFRQASGLDAKAEERQVNTLIYTMGDQADDILCSFKLEGADLKKYDTVKAKFESHFVKRRNKIFERAKFNQRVQKAGEPVDSFITALYCLSEHCEYNDLRDEMIRDRIVVGISNSKLSEQLQLDPELKLETAIAKVRQSEAVKQQQSVVRGKENELIETVSSESESESVEVVYSRKPPKYHGKKKSHRAVQATRKPSSGDDSCTRCGKSPNHSKFQCPAFEAICHKCSKRGHFQVMCRSTSNVSSIISEDDDAFLGTVQACADVATVESTGSNPWEISLKINAVYQVFKIDTGADVTVIPKSMFQKLSGAKLHHSTKRLRGASLYPLSVVGQFKGTLQYKERSIEEEIFVIEGLETALVGRPAIQALGLVVRVDAVAGVNIEDTIVSSHPKLFSGLGEFSGEYTVRLKEGAKPFALTTPRRVALPLLKKVKKELERMQSLGVIRRVDEPTLWCAGMVVVPKANGSVRICVDLTRLNENVCRERHILPSVEQSLAQLGGAKVFSKLDANSGFWQVKLSEESALLTTFITPYGRFCFNRLPFGITSAPEYFQKRMSQVLAGLEGNVCMVDDVLVYGTTQAEHDKNLAAVLKQIEEAGITLNREKCSFSKSSVKFLGHVIEASGIKPDPEKVKAIQDMPEPTNMSELRRFLGMINQMGRFTPSIAEKGKPLRDLLSKQCHWLWGNAQRQAFNELKQLLSSQPVLALYDPNKRTIISADASSYGLGAVLTQVQDDGNNRPVAFASRALSKTEQRYAQIEKEGLAITWACERFQEYVIGLEFHVETDHKPLVPLFSTKILDELPPRIQRFKMRLMRFKFSISHVPGKSLTTADALSRAPIRTSQHVGLSKQEVDAFVNLVVANMPATEKCLDNIRQKQEEDEACKQIMSYCQNSWPAKEHVPPSVKQFYPFRDELTVVNGLLLRGIRIVIPVSLRMEILEKLHTGHQGITKCRERARQSVWWPGLSSQLAERVKNCTLCCKDRYQRPEPLIPSTLPALPWQKVGTDLFYLRDCTYLLVIDYFSRYIEISKLEHTSSDSVIRHMKSIFARHGIPEVVMSDNGPQYSSYLFAEFAKNYGFNHITSSPRFPQSNGEAERAVKTVKGLLKKSTDPYLALLTYRATPLRNGYSPSELLMNRKLRTTVPIVRNQLRPSVPDIQFLQKKEREIKDQQKAEFDKRHCAKPGGTLHPGDLVWIPDNKCNGSVTQNCGNRSYVVATSRGQYLRRNRRHLIRIQDSDHEVNEDILPPVIEGQEGERETSEEQPRGHEMETSEDATNENSNATNNRPVYTTQIYLL